MKPKLILFLLTLPFLIYLFFFRCGGDEPNLKEIKTYSDYGFEFQYPGDWKAVHQDKHIHISNEVVFEMGISYIVDRTGISREQRLADLVRDEKGIKTPISRLTFNESIEGIRIVTDPNDASDVFRTRTEYFVAGKKNLPIVIIIEDSIKGWQRDFLGIELIFKSLKELDPT